MNPANISQDDLPKNPPDSEFSSNLKARHRIGKIWYGIILVATIFGIVALGTLLVDISNDTAGYSVIKYKVEPTSLTGGRPLEVLSKNELVNLLQENVSKNRISNLEKQKPFEERSIGEIRELFLAEIAKPKIEETYSLYESLFNKAAVFADASEKYPGSFIVFRSWISKDFLTLPQSTNALIAGIRSAILGSLWIIFISIIVALPIGTGAAIYLEEYARGKENFINRIIQLNINNLAGVPSIIYGLLGLAVFVRVLEPLTSGKFFGVVNSTTANGRTILSAGLTIALLILPLIIINAQEAIKAVPNSLREAGLGVGATKWQTIWSHVLPYALPGILTGSILAISRAFGETAPLVVIGAATYITFDPTGVFSKFTTLPIQIYQWTSRPQNEFRNLAAAAIIVLLVLLLALNAFAIILRNKFSRRYV